MRIKRLRATPPPSTTIPPAPLNILKRLPFTPTPTFFPVRTLRQTPLGSTKPPGDLVSIRTTPPFVAPASALTILTTRDVTTLKPISLTTPIFTRPFTRPLNTTPPSTLKTTSTLPSSHESSSHLPSTFKEGTSDNLVSSQPISLITPIFTRPFTRPLTTTPLSTLKNEGTSDNIRSEAALETIIHTSDVTTKTTLSLASSTSLPSSPTAEQANSAEPTLVSVDPLNPVNETESITQVIRSEPAVTIIQTNHSPLSLNATLTSTFSPVIISDFKNTLEIEGTTNDQTVNNRSTVGQTAESISSSKILESLSTTATGISTTEARRNETTIDKAAKSTLTDLNPTSAKTRADVTTSTVRQSTEVAAGKTTEAQPLKTESGKDSTTSANMSYQQTGSDVTSGRQNTPSGEWREVTEFSINGSHISSDSGLTITSRSTVSPAQVLATSPIWVYALIFSLIFLSLLLLILLITVLWRAYLRHYWSAFLSRYCCVECCPRNPRIKPTESSNSAQTLRGFPHYLVDPMAVGHSNWISQRIPDNQSMITVSNGRPITVRDSEGEKLLETSNPQYRTVIKIPGSITYQQYERDGTVTKVMGYPPKEKFTANVMGTQGSTFKSRPYSYNNTGFLNEDMGRDNALAMPYYPFANYPGNIFFPGHPGYLMNDNYPYNPRYHWSGRTPSVPVHSVQKRAVSGRKERGLYPRLSLVSPGSLGSLPTYSAIINASDIDATPAPIDVPDSQSRRWGGGRIFGRMFGKSPVTQANKFNFQEETLLAGEDVPDHSRSTEANNNARTVHSNYQRINRGESSKNEVVTDFRGNPNGNASTHGWSGIGKQSKQKIVVKNRQRPTQISTIDEEQVKPTVPLEEDGRRDPEHADGIPLLAWDNERMKEPEKAVTVNSAAAASMENVQISKPTQVKFMKDQKAVIVIQ